MNMAPASKQSFSQAKHKLRHTTYQEIQRETFRVN
jgi:hypothetical protein